MGSSKLDELIEKIKIMEPGFVMSFIASQLNQSPAKFLLTHAGTLAASAVKNGWIKGAAIKDAIKDFKGKNAEDKSGIDYKKLELDEDTVKLKCLFDGDSVKKLQQFKKDFDKQLEDAEADQKEADNKLKADAKKAGLDVDDDVLKDDGVIVAGVIDREDNKGLKPKELNAQLKAKLELKRQLEEMKKRQEEIMKKLAGIDDVDIDAAIKNNEIAVEISKKGDVKKSDKKDNEKDSDKKDDKKPTKESESLLEDNAAKLVFSCAGASSLVDDQAIKNAAYAIGKTVSNKEEAMKKFTEWLKDAAANRGPKGTFSALDTKDLERTLFKRPDTTVLKGLQEYAAKVFDNPDAISNEVSQKIIDSAADGSVDPSEFKVEFVADSDSDFGRLIHAMHDLDTKDPEKIKDAAATIKRFREFASNFPKDDPFYLNACKGAEAMYAAKTGNVLDGSTASKELIEKAKGFKGGIKQFADNMERGFDKSGIEQMADNATEPHSGTSVSVGQAGDPDAFAGAGTPEAQKALAQVENAYKSGLIPTDSKGHVFSYMHMSKQIMKLDDVFDDGKLDPAELKKLEAFKARLDEYQQWAEAHADSTDSRVRDNVALIRKTTAKFNRMIADNQDFLNDVDRERLGGSPSSAKAMAGDDQMKEEMQKKSGITMFTALGWARLAAKTTGYILNHGKTVVDVLGAHAIKKEEDKYIVASMSALLSNGKDSKSDMSDTKFSVRYSLKDFKWHATCLDNRKLKFPEKDVVDLMLNSDVGKKFKESCVSKWSKVFAPDGEEGGVVKFVLDNFERIGLKADGNTKKLLATVKNMSENFDKIKNSFK